MSDQSRLDNGGTSPAGTAVVIRPKLSRWGRRFRRVAFRLLTRLNLPTTTSLVIVAIGSSSTQGAGASGPAHTYPALLAEELRRRWPHLTVTVVNKGVGGEIAAQMLARFTRDVLPYRPQLVIWQTGSNQVLKSQDVQGYEKTVREGIAQLRAAHMDVILLDPQYAPRVLGRPLHTAVLDTLEKVADDLKVALFHRFAVMRHWVGSGQIKMEDIVSRDQLHMNDASYTCIARLLADSLAAATLATPPAHADRPVETRSGPAR